MYEHLFLSTITVYTQWLTYSNSTYYSILYNVYTIICIHIMCHYDLLISIKYTHDF